MCGNRSRTKKLKKMLIIYDNPEGNITNSDLEMATELSALTVLQQLGEK